MKLAFSTNAYLNFSFADTASRLANIGYAGLELMADVPHAWPAYLLASQKQAIREAMAANKLQFSNVNAFMMHAVDDQRQKYWHPSWIEPDAHYRRVRTEHTKKALSLAAELGAPCVTTEPGGPLDGRSWNECLKMFVEELKPVVAHAEKVGVPLLVEPEPDLLIETADQYLEFAKHFNTPYLGLNFDIGHFYCVKDDPAATVHKLAPLIKHVHLEDIAATRKHHHLVPGEGVIDFHATLRALHEVKYADWVTIELYTYHENPDVAARTARERVLKIAADVGVTFSN